MLEYTMTVLGKCLVMQSNKNQSTYYLKYDYVVRGNSGILVQLNCTILFKRTLYHRFTHMKWASKDSRL